MKILSLSKILVFFLIGILLSLGSFSVQAIEYYYSEKTLFTKVNNLTTVGETTLVSISSDGIQANGESIFSAMSSDGRYIVFS